MNTKQDTLSSGQLDHWQHPALNTVYHTPLTRPKLYLSSVPLTEAYLYVVSLEKWHVGNKRSSGSSQISKNI